ncbi:hypothetical protein ACP70R_005657 [Stipagrostis hirtigluma subsp. patula]
MKEKTMTKFGVIALTLALLYATLQAQGATEAATAAAGGAAESSAYVLLEPMPERVVAAAPGDDVVVVNATNQVCGSCKCCFKDNPNSCLTTCCFDKTCNGSACTLRFLTCGCTICQPLAGGKMS